MYVFENADALTFCMYYEYSGMPLILAADQLVTLW